MINIKKNKHLNRQERTFIEIRLKDGWNAYKIVKILNRAINTVLDKIKCCSVYRIFDRHANLKYKYGNRQFWCKGYYVDTVGRNKNAIEKYIRNQIQEDIVYEQMSLKEYIDQFTGESVKKNK